MGKYRLYPWGLSQAWPPRAGGKGCGWVQYVTEAINTINMSVQLWLRSRWEETHSVSAIPECSRGVKVLAGVKEFCVGVSSGANLRLSEQSDAECSRGCPCQHYHVCLFTYGKPARLGEVKGHRCVFSLQNPERPKICQNLRQIACLTPIPFTRLQNPYKSSQGTVSLCIPAAVCCTLTKLGL